MRMLSFDIYYLSKFIHLLVLKWTFP